MNAAGIEGEFTLIALRFQFAKGFLASLASRL